MDNQEMVSKLVLELYSQITKELKEEGLTESVVNAIKAFTTLLSSFYF